MLNNQTQLKSVDSRKATKRLTQKTSFLRDDKTLFIGRSYIRLASTILLIFASLLPYSDIILGYFIDVHSIKLNRFPNLATAMWTHSVCISPLLIIIASKFHPYKYAYIFPIYVYVTMICGLVFLDFNIHIDSDWVFRGITFIISLTILVFGNYLKKYLKLIKIKEEVLDELIKLRTNE